MPSNTQPLTDEELEMFENGRDLGADLLESIHQMNAGLGTVIYSPLIALRQQTGLSTTQFAALLGVSIPTLQDWEQGRCQPEGAAKTLLKVAERHPEILREVAEA